MTGFFNIQGTLGTVLNYAVLIAGAIVVCAVAAWVLKFVLRFVFRQIRFIVCLVIVVLLIGGFAVKSAIAPIQRVLDETGAADAMSAVVEQFKGVYSSAMPLLAWRFTDITQETAENESVFEDDGEGESGGDEVRIKIDYMPIGSSVVVYDKSTGAVRIDKDVNED